MDLLEHLVIPGIVLGTSGTAGLIRIMRNNLLDELGKPYVTTARAKGLSGWKVVIKYPVRVAINPFISGIGEMLPALVGGSVIVSMVLSLPTVGPILLAATLNQDMYMAGRSSCSLGSSPSSESSFPTSCWSSSIPASGSTADRPPTADEGLDSRQQSVSDTMDPPPGPRDF